MEKYYHLQRKLWWIPFVSTCSIAVSTEIFIRKRKASFWNELLLYSLIVVAVVSSILGSKFLFSGEYPLLIFVYDWGIFTIANLVMLEMQKKLLITATEEDKPKRFKTKYFWILVFIIPLIFAAVYCSVVIIQSLNNYDDIPDLNGADDYSLNTITHEEILSSYESGDILAGQYSLDGNRTTVTGELEQIDRDSVGFRGSRFSGWDCLQATISSYDTVTLTITSEVESGNFAILIEVDGELYGTASPNQEQRIELTNVKDKLIIVKVAGESAKFKVKSIRSFS